MKTGSKLEIARIKLQEELHNAYSSFYKETACGQVTIELDTCEHRGMKGKDMMVLTGCKAIVECECLPTHRESIPVEDAGLSKDAIRLLQEFETVERCSMCGEFLPLRIQE